jgi:hypothetical protein
MRAEKDRDKIIYFIPVYKHEAMVISKGIEARMEKIIAGRKAASSTKATTPHFQKGAGGFHSKD